MPHDESPVEGKPSSASSRVNASPSDGSASRAGSALEVARRVLVRVDAGAYATLTLSGELQRAVLDESARALCTELVYGSLRRQARLDRALAALAPRGLGGLDTTVRALLRLGAYQLLFTRVPPPLAVNTVVESVRRLRGPGLANFVNAILRRLDREGEPPSPLPSKEAKDSDYIAALSVRHALPTFLVADVLQKEGRSEAAALCESLESPAPLWLRLNTLRGSPETLLRALVREGIEVAEDAAPPLTLPEAVRLAAGHPFSGAAYGHGFFTAQDLGAQLVARLLVADTQDGPLALPAGPILDACAGIGGKTTHLAALMESSRDIDAADRSARKLELCREHAHRLGCERVFTLELDLLNRELLKERLRPRYAAILLDAPCSGVGVLRRHPEARRRLSVEKVQELCAMQRRLLKNLAPHVSPGGVLVYAVCSFLSQEGADQAAAFLREHREFELLPPASTQPPWQSLAFPLRTLPHRHDADGFYAVRFRRKS